MTTDCGVAMPLVDAALAYTDAGLSVIATREDKRPVAAWKQYQTTRPNGYQVASMFGDDHAYGVAVICGGVSGGLECIDFDGGGVLCEPWISGVEDESPGLPSRLPIESSPSGGRHVFYRVAGGAVPGNTKLAARVTDVGGTECLIETRGEGGYVVVSPTPGYNVIDGDFTDIPTITPEEREILIRAARALDERPIKTDDTVSRPADGRQMGGGCQRPGDDFNHRGDVRAMLQRHGWQHLRTVGVNEHWRRPGKSVGGLSATLRDVDGVPVFYVFSSSTEFEPGKGYGSFQVYAILEHGGDFAAAAGALRRQGFGEERVRPTAATPSGNNQPPPVAVADNIVERLPTTNPFRDGAALARESDEAVNPVIADALELGDKAVVIGAPKCRKSFFCLQLALSIAAGVDAMGFTIPKARRVAIAQYEIKEGHYRKRIKRTLHGLGLTPDDLDDRLRVASLRGRDISLDAIGEYLNDFEPELIILDPVYKLYKAGTDENRAGDMAALLREIDLLATKCNAATLLVHHDPKGATGETKLTSRGAGSGVLARDYDASFILTPHIQDTDAIVLSSVLRNYADRNDVCLRWEGFSFVPDFTLHPTPETSITKAAKVRQGPRSDELIEAAKKWIEEDGGKMASVALQDKLQRVFSVGRDKRNEAIQLLEVSHNYRRAKDPDTGKSFIYSPSFKPQLPELPELSGLPFQEVQKLAPGTS